MTCRNESQWRRNRGKTWAPGQVRGEPADCPDGVRHVGGASLIWALVWNVGTCRPDTVAAPVGWRREGVPQADETARGRVPMRGTGADRLVLVMKLVNTNAGGGSVSDGGPADCGAVRVMEVVWPSGIALREEVPNHCALRPLTAARGERHRKRRAMSASGVVREDGWKYLSLTRRNLLS
jgi:hypothetical protein